MKNCPSCNTEKQDSEFHINRSKPSGLDWRCKTCKHLNQSVISRRLRDARRYEKDKNKVLARLAAREFYGNSQKFKCSVLNCGEISEHFHHVNYLMPLDVIPFCKVHHNFEHG